MKNNLLENYKQRCEVLDRIEKYESLGGEYFFLDVEDDPPSQTLMPNDVDYLNKKLSSKIKNLCALKMAKKMQKIVTKQFNITIEGLENARNIKGGAVLTSNHFSIYENVAVMNVAEKIAPKKKFYRVIREGNYFMPGKIGFLLKHANTLPLSSNPKTMMNFNRSIDKLLSDGNLVLVYPEQSMWWNYKKIRPFKMGAFHFAVRNKVPVIPCFTTLKENGKIDENGMPSYDYTIHVLKPIYPILNLPIKEASKIMADETFRQCKEKYEEVYKTPLIYKNQRKEIYA